MALNANLNVALRGNVILRTDTSDHAILAQFQTKPNTAYQCFFKITAYRTQNDAEAGFYWRRAAFRTNANGVLTQVSTTQTPAADIEDTAAWTVTVIPSGTKISVEADASGSPVYWAVDSEIHVVDNVPQT